MHRRNALFAEYDFASAVSNAPRKLAEAIDKLSDDQLFRSDTEGVLDRVVNDHLITVPVLDVAATKASQREIDVDLSDDPRERFMRDLSGPYLVKATEVTFRVPYKGEADVF